MTRVSTGRADGRDARADQECGSRSGSDGGSPAPGAAQAMKVLAVSDALTLSQQVYFNNHSNKHV